MVQPVVCSLVDRELGMDVSLHGVVVRVVLVLEAHGVGGWVGVVLVVEDQEYETWCSA